MNHNGQENIDLREPVASWQKVLISLVAVLLMSILLSCCLKVCGSNQEELIARLAGAIIVAFHHLGPVLLVGEKISDVRQQRSGDSSRAAVVQAYSLHHARAQKPNHDATGELLSPQ